ncbi:MAG: Na/Pi cotransporter family protein [Oscillospiraceae bacterium]|nr:Na/Pi cotransporter family protein [Oscillospiraceae bacterium]
MGFSDIFWLIFGLLGGLALFLFGLQNMASGLQKVAGKRAHSAIEKLTSIPIIGVLVGTVVTIAVQSSTLVSVMLVGFVNAGVMNLKQAVAVIFGANIGTTLTAQIVAFRVTDFWVVLAAVGFVAFFFFKKHRGVKNTGNILFFIGVLLLGLALMSDAMRPLRTDPGFQNLMATFSDHALLAFFAGFAFTALIQSSSAATAMIVTMAAEGIIGFDAALPIILGINVGTCITAVFSSIGTKLSARRTAMAHVLFNTIAALAFMLFLNQFSQLVMWISPSVDYGYVAWCANARYDYIRYCTCVADHVGSVVARQAANAHLLFSVISVAVFLPLITPFVKLVRLVVPGKEEPAVQEYVHLDWNMTGTPSIAISLARQELARMARMAADNVTLAMECFREQEDKKLQKLFEQEQQVNALEKQISRYLAKIAQNKLGTVLSISHSKLINAANDIERISDHAENIAEIAQIMIDDDIKLSEQALEELELVYGLVKEILELAVVSIEEDTTEHRSRISELEDLIDTKEQELRTAHIDRLREGICDPDSGIVFFDMLGNFERIGDHSNNISYVPGGKI